MGSRPGEYWMVCGLPCSGNRLVNWRISQGRVATKVHHGMQPERLATAHMLVIPYRIDENARQRSIRRQGMEHRWPPDRDLTCRKNVIEAMKTTPWFSISYEAILESKGQALDDILVGTYGFNLPAWRTDVSDAARPERGPIFANEEERLLAHERQASGP